MTCYFEQPAIGRIKTLTLTKTFNGIDPDWGEDSVWMTPSGVCAKTTRPQYRTAAIVTCIYNTPPAFEKQMLEVSGSQKGKSSLDDLHSSLSGERVQYFRKRQRTTTTKKKRTRPGVDYLKAATKEGWWFQSKDFCATTSQSHPSIG